MRVLQLRQLGLALPLLFLPNLSAEPVPVRYPQGTAHGFLVVKTLDGKRIANADLIQTVKGDTVTSHLIFYFRDGSLDDELTVYTQSGVMRLLTDHHIQRGPSFPSPIDVTIDATTGQVTTRQKDGTMRQDHLDLPADLANGLPPTLLMNLDPAAPETRVSYLVPTEKPRLVHLSIKPGGDIPFTTGSMSHKSMDYIIHVEIGGIAGVVAPIIGKEPKDKHVRILTGIAPAFIREEGQGYEGGPVWRIEQVSPVFSR